MLFSSSWIAAIRSGDAPAGETADLVGLMTLPPGRSRDQRSRSRCGRLSGFSCTTELLGEMIARRLPAGFAARRNPRASASMQSVRSWICTPSSKISSTCMRWRSPGAVATVRRLQLAIDLGGVEILVLDRGNAVEAKGAAPLGQAVATRRVRLQLPPVAGERGDEAALVGIEHHLASVIRASCRSAAITARSSTSSARRRTELSSSTSPIIHHPVQAACSLAARARADHDQVQRQYVRCERRTQRLRRCCGPWQRNRSMHRGAVRPAPAARSAA